jgi:hypothetical protein
VKRDLLASTTFVKFRLGTAQEENLKVKRDDVIAYGKSYSFPAHDD